jgi:hypothetical protein
MLAKDVAGDDLGALCLRNVGSTLRQDGVAIVSLAVLGEEADESLWLVSERNLTTSLYGLCTHTENEVMITALCLVGKGNRFIA